MTKRNFKTAILLALTGIFILAGCKREGCTDPSALNYDPDAKKEDGSCLYDSSSGNVVTVIDNGSGVGTTTWTSDKIYVLDGFVFVNNGQTLTIEAGTVIKGLPGTGTDASALIVARGGKIMAQGTSTEPIIFTAEQDDVDDPNDIPVGTRGLWGGVIILGKAQLNSSPGETSVEGIPTTESRGLYGGTDDTDNSGVFSYVSIRYGGTDIGAGNEINGLTLAGVGSATTLDHIEIIFNADDGIEFFGGVPQVKYAVSAFCADDAFDYDEGFRGKGQFWFAIHDATDGDRGGEHDGGTTPEDGNPYAHPLIYNATYAGRGESAGKRTLTFRDNAGGEYHNSIFVDYGEGVDVELLASGQDSYDRYVAGELKLQGNIFWNVNGNSSTGMFTVSLGSGVTSVDSTAAANALNNYFSTGGNQVLDPMISIARVPDGSLNLNPAESLVLSGATTASDPWFDAVDYYGAFDASSNWLSGWTLLDFAGYF